MGFDAVKARLVQRFARDSKAGVSPKVACNSADQRVGQAAELQVVGKLARRVH